MDGGIILINVQEVCDVGCIVVVVGLGIYKVDDFVVMLKVFWSLLGFVVQESV